MNTYYVYILASKRNGTIYIGVTNDLIRRISEHKAGLVPGFTKKYGVKRLVWLDQCDDIGVAIQREKQMKAWKRAWKIRLIEETNKEWKDLTTIVKVGSKLNAKVKKAASQKRLENEGGGGVNGRSIYHHQGAS